MTKGEKPETKTITYYKPTLVLTSYPPKYKHPDGSIRMYPPEPEVDFQIEVPMDEENSKKLKELMNKTTNETAKATMTFQYEKKEKYSIKAASIALAELLFEGLTIGDFGWTSHKYGEIVNSAVEERIQIDMDIVNKHLNELRRDFYK